jgi:hypothetical protein
MPVSEAEKTHYPPKYAGVVTAADRISEAASKLRYTLAGVDAHGNAADACRLGKAIALIAIAERAAMDASATLGRTSADMWK